jgi:hypothetical protein
MGVFGFLIFIPIIVNPPQRCQISPGEVTLPEVEDMEMDGPTTTRPSENDDGKASAEKSLHESRSPNALARRENKDALRALCQDRGLDDTLCKIELATQLIAWVSTIFSPMR